MNVIGHMVCAEHLGRDAGLGAMLPDLLSLYDRRIRPLRLIQPKHAVDSELDGSGSLRDGVRFHFHVDSSFHRSDLFRDCADLIRHRLLAASDAPGLKRFAVAHVLTELFLDHLLIVQDPLRLQLFYGSLERHRTAPLRSMLVAQDGVDWEGFSAFLKRLVEARFADAYLEPEGLLDRTDRILLKLRQRRLDLGERAAALDGLSVHAPLAQRQLDEFIEAMQRWRAPAALRPEGAVDSGGQAGIE